MRHAALNQRRQRLVPRGRRLPGQPGNQIQIQVGNPRRAQPPHVLLNHSAVVKTAADLRLAVDERLHAHAHAIHADGRHRAERLARDLPRRAFHGDLRIRLQIELRANRRKKLGEQCRRKQTGRSAAEVNRVYGARQLEAHASSPISGCGQILNHPVHVAHMLACRVHPRGEVAIGAL